METIINKLPEDINYMFYIKHRGDKRFSTYNPGKGTMGTGLVFTELYRKEHLLAICKWIAEDNSGEWIYQLRSAGGKKIYWEYDSIAATPAETPQISTETAETVNVSAEGEKAEKTPVFSSREEVITYLDKTHGIEYDAGEVVYLKDGCCAEEHADGSEWCIYRNEDSDECVETVRIAPQSPETPQTGECTGESCKLAQTA